MNPGGNIPTGEKRVTIVGTVKQETVVDFTEEIPAYWVQYAFWENDSSTLIVEFWEDGERYGKPSQENKARAGDVKYKRKRVPWENIAAALGAIARGEHGIENSYQRRAALDLILDPDDADYDAITVDLAVQIATFREVMFG